MKYFVILFAVMDILFSTLSAQVKWTVDKSHTMILFTVPHMVISEVTGQFHEFDAAMESSKEDFSDATITVTIKAKSINTGTLSRDNHLRSADFFNADIDSIITFTSTGVEKNGSDNLIITGFLTMRGISKQVTLEAQFKGTVTTRRGTIAAFKATGTVPRKEWGLNWNRTIETGGLVVGENVELTILAEFIKPKS